MSEKKNKGEIMVFPTSRTPVNTLVRINKFCKYFEEKNGKSPSLKEICKAFPRVRIGALSTSVDSWVDFDYLYDGRRVGKIARIFLSLDDLLEQDSKDTLIRPNFRPKEGGSQ